MSGSVQNEKRLGENPVLNETVELAVLEVVVMDGTISTSVQRVLKKYKFHPYNIQLLQQLNEDDFHLCMKF